jgi:hypothetical protein
MSCSYSSTIVKSYGNPTTTYVDTGLANGFAEYYRVQALYGNCDGPVSNCVAVTPAQP